MARRVTAGYGVSLISALAAASMVFAGSAGAKTTISFAGWYNTNDELNAMKHIGEAYEKANPNTKIKMVGIQWGGDRPYLEKLVVMAAGNSMPDVVLIPFQLYPRIGESGIIADLSPYIAKDKSIKLDNWSPVAIAASKLGGRMFGLPSTLDSYWVTFNDRLFQEAGLMSPDKVFEKGEWTFDAMIAAGQKLTTFTSSGKLDKVGILQMGDVDSSVSPWLYAMGGSVLNEAGTVCLLDTKESVDGFRYFYDAFFKRKAGAIAWGPPYFPDLTTFSKAGKFAMSPWWQSVVGYHKSQKGKWRIDFVPMPAGPVSSATAGTTVHEATMSKQCKNKEAAWSFLKFLAGPEGSSILQREVAWFQSSRQAEAQYTKMMQEDGCSGVRFLPEAVKRMRQNSRTVKYDQVWPAISDSINKIYTGKIDLETGLRNAVKAADIYLKRIKK